MSTPDFESCTSSSNQNNGQDSPAPFEAQTLSGDLRELRSENDYLIAELESLRVSYQVLQLIYAEKEENLAKINEDKEEVSKHNSELLETIKVVSSERDSLSYELNALKASSREREVELVRETEEIRGEREICKYRVEELLKEKSEKSRNFSENLDSIKQGLSKVIDSLNEEGEDHSHELELNGDLGLDLKGVLEVVKNVGLKLDEFKEKRKKVKRELENSLVSLTEENRDINNLLRIALVEKEAVEKSLNKLKGNNEHKRGAILQIAERGLQRVGFGFIVGTSGNELSSENFGANAAAKSDSSECEEEAVSLVIF